MEIAIELAWQMPQNSLIPRAENRWEVVEHIDKVIEQYGLNEESEDIDEIVGQYLSKLDKVLHLVLANRRIIFEGYKYWVIDENNKPCWTILDHNSDLSKIGYETEKEALEHIENNPI